MASTYGAVALEGERAAMSLPGAIADDVMLFFVKQSLRPGLRPGDIVYMDNVPAHKTAAIAEEIELVGARL